MRLDYSKCDGCENKPYNEACQCTVDFTLDTKFSGSQVMMYYGLERLAFFYPEMYIGYSFRHFLAACLLEIAILNLNSCLTPAAVQCHVM